MKCNNLKNLSQKYHYINIYWFVKCGLLKLECQTLTRLIYIYVIGQLVLVFSLID